MNAPEQYADLKFPRKGINETRGFGVLLPPDDPSVTVEGTNVQLYETETGRARGGSRPGLVKYITPAAGDGTFFQDLNVVYDGTPAEEPAGSIAFTQFKADIYRLPGDELFTEASIAADLPVSVGDLVCFFTEANRAVTGVTDDLGNTYAEAIAGVSTYTGIALWWVKSGFSGTPTITATFEDDSDHCDIAMASWDTSGATSITLTDAVTTSDYGGFATTASTGNLTASAGDLKFAVFSCFNGYNATTIVAGGNQTIEGTGTAPPQDYWILVDWIDAPAGTNAITLTNGGSPDEFSYVTSGASFTIG